MDHEPERCRRTDGRKWRCKKNVVPFQKYCEGHMHRGCRGSRKLVESEPRRITSLKHDGKINGGTEKCLKSLDNLDTSAGIDESKRRLSSATESLRCKQLNISSIVTVVSTVADTPYTVSTAKASPIQTGGESNRGYSIEGIPVSLKQGRCQRRDGKNWQCKRNALPNGKYCDPHIHRGAKRSRLVLEESTLISPTVVTTAINSDAAPSSSHGINSSGSTSSGSTAEARNGLAVISQFSAGTGEGRA